MPVLKLWQNDTCREIFFEGETALKDLLRQRGCWTDHPCGGRGSCGKCAVRAAGGLCLPTEAEQKAGCRLSCQLKLRADAEVWLPDGVDNRIELSGSLPVLGNAMGSGAGAAVDVGTTTLALKLYDLQTGALMAECGMLNPQRSIAADVMGRIGAAMAGQLSELQEMAVGAVKTLLQTACGRAGISAEQVDFLVVTGNTTMLYLLTGRNPSCLSAAPFRADCLFGKKDTLLGLPVYYPPCLDAFVGADITCAVLDSGMDLQEKTSLLCDIGTNGEIVLWKDGTLYITSTAAGPAFEGAGISCGCGSIPGAIDRVWVEDGKIRVHTVGEKPAVGLCGSGLVDAVAAFLQTGDIDETGAVEEVFLPLSEFVRLLPADIRAVQLAKGAIAAGVRTLLEQAGITEEQIDVFYIAGGFGSHLNVASAAAIGLIPEKLAPRSRILGNAALSGAAGLLLDRARTERAEQLRERIISVNLGGNSRFNNFFMEAMLFGGDLWE